VSGFYIGQHVSCYAGGLSEQGHKYVIEAWKGIKQVKTASTQLTFIYSSYY
jgi:hypothetical protein